MTRLRQIASTLEDSARDMVAASNRRWAITQGTSRTVVRAPNYAAAVERAAAIGFRDPDAVVLVEETRPTTDRDRQLVGLKLTSPMRSTRDQADAGHLPLFVAGNEPTLL